MGNGDGGALVPVVLHPLQYGVSNLGRVYLSDFTLELEGIIKNVSEKNQHIYITGDINIDFLKYNDHPKTEEHLDMLYSNNLVPLKTKPTRITNHTATLIDHIYTNVPIHDTVSGIALVDLSDHFPVFLHL